MNVYEKQRVTISISEQVLNWLDSIAAEYGVSRSWLVENMLYGIMVRQDENKQTDK